MDEDWDDPAPVTINNYDGDTGRAFSKGRGFSSAIDNDPPGDDWDDNPTFESSNGNNDFGAGSGRFDKPRGRGRGRGRGGGGGRGGRGGNRGGYNGNFNGSDDADNSDDGGRYDDAPSRGGFRGGRGGRGGNRGGRGGYGDAGNDRGGRGGHGDTGNDREEKKREIYVPPDPTQDVDEMFHSGNTSGINFMKYDNIEVKTTGENIPPPIRTFEESNLRSLILDNVKKSGYLKPTPIQKHAIPIVMNSRDLMGCAQTGSGKTAAFLLPIIHTLLSNQSELPVPDGTSAEPSAVIVSPTRELSIQIFEQARKFAYGSILKIAIVYGGTSVNYQKSNVTKGCHILVATPGRLNDFVSKGWVRFNSTRFIVLDEADRMLDMGFLPAVEEVLSHSTMNEASERNTLMFSATFPDEIQMLAGKFLNNYIFVAVGIVGGACSDVEQVFYQVERFKKRQKLLDILKEEGTEKTLIFVETKRTADFMATFLSENGLNTTSIHGDRQQREREVALNEFQKGVRDILVATGVAARGLDIKDVKHVINFDLPKYIDEYVHRIGRTGRVGNRGKATSFFDNDNDLPLANHLVKILKQADQPIPDWLEKAGKGKSMYESSAFGGEDVRGDNFGEAQSSSQHPVEELDEGW